MRVSLIHAIFYGFLSYSSLFFFENLAHSQNVPGGADAATTTNISIEFTAVAWDQDFNNISIINGAKPQKLEIPAFRQSSVYKYSGSVPIIFELNDVNAAKANPGYKPFTSSVRIPGEWSKVIFLIFPKDSHSFAVLPVNNNTKEFKFGSIRIMNVTGEEIAMKTQLGGVLLPPGGQQIFTIPSGDQQLEFLYAHKEDGQWVPAGSDAFPVTSTERRTVFITKTNSDFFAQVEQVMGDDGKWISRRLPSHVFQLFSIAESVKKSQ
ncbi:MAG TPA: hypothetical protein VL357_05705 [Rariglobus sp.]|jgi:hypothetical protein|nr:hypothetical protein [Rariglobus sp.]